MLIWQSDVGIVGTYSLAADGLTYFIPSCSRGSLLFRSGGRDFKAAERRIADTEGIFFGREGCTGVLGRTPAISVLAHQCLFPTVGRVNVETRHYEAVTACGKGIDCFYA
jgi:hypothetical protein